MLVVGVKCFDLEFVAGYGYRLYPVCVKEQMKHCPFDACAVTYNCWEKCEDADYVDCYDDECGDKHFDSDPNKFKIFEEVVKRVGDKAKIVVLSSVPFPRWWWPRNLLDEKTIGFWINMRFDIKEMHDVQGVCEDVVKALVAMKYPIWLESWYCYPTQIEILKMIAERYGDYKVFELGHGIAIVKKQ